MRVVVAALVTTLSASAALANQSLERAMTLLFDYNDDGTLSPTELTDMQEEIERIKNRVASERQQIADRKRDEFKPQLWKTGFLVRDVYQTGAFLDESYVEGDGGARLTFVNDFATGAAALTASGSLMYGAFGEVNRLTNPVYLGFLGGVDFNTRWAGGKYAGWVAANAGFEAGGDLGTGGNFQYFKGNLIYTTDIEAKASVLNVETRWMPFISALGIGSLHHLGSRDQVAFLFRPALSLDYAHVWAPGEFSNLMPGTHYLWGGVKTKLDVFFRTDALKNLRLGVKYNFLYDIFRGGGSNIHFLEATASYRLNAQTSIRAVYTWGTEPRTLDRRNDLLVGLTVQLGGLTRPK